MRKAVLVLVVIGVAALMVAFYPLPVEKPEKDGQGSLAVWIDPRFPAPEYHSPLESWQTHHFEALNRGDLLQSDCLYCHEPERSCNNCHAYVGVDPIVPTP